MVFMLLTKCHLYDAMHKQPKIIMHLLDKLATGKVKVFLDDWSGSTPTDVTAAIKECIMEVCKGLKMLNYKRCNSGQLIGHA